MDATAIKPRAFIGSSTVGEPIARAVEQNLNHESETYLWPHIFPPGKGNLESLVETARTIDFAVLVFTPDDLTESKGQTMDSPRDNVLFELGLFMGRLGRERTFAVYNRDEPIKLPSDLAGVTLATYPKYELPFGGDELDPARCARGRLRDARRSGKRHSPQHGHHLTPDCLVTIVTTLGCGVAGCWTTAWGGAVCPGSSCT